jgi:hypothetical protein
MDTAGFHSSSPILAGNWAAKYTGPLTRKMTVAQRREQAAIALLQGNATSLVWQARRSLRQHRNQAHSRSGHLCQCGAVSPIRWYQVLPVAGQI